MSQDDIERGRLIVESGVHNGHDPYADVPPPDEAPDEVGRTEPTTWEPVDLRPYLRGEIEPVKPSIGAHRSDGQQLLYPGLEHSVIAHTAAGKTWFSIMCAMAEMLSGNTAVYLHFEESTPASTVERLLRTGLDADTINKRLMFAAPSRALRHGWLDPLLAAKPTLVVVDGVNEAMVLHGQKIDLEGWSAVRRQIVVPFKEIGAAVLECDHLPITADPLRGDAYGTVHKGNVIDGARFALVRKDTFGRGRRGRSYLYATKDRPGWLKGKDDGKGTFLGTFVVDDTDSGPDFLTLYAPREESPAEKQAATPAEMADVVHQVIEGLDGGMVGSQRKLYAAIRAAGHSFREQAIRSAVDDLLFAGRLREVPGKRGSTGFEAISTAAQGSDS